MNYNTIVVPEKGLACTREQADAIQAILDEDNDSDDHEGHGFEFTFEDGMGYLEAPESGSWSMLSDALLTAIGTLIGDNGKEFLEFGVAFTAGRLVPGSHGGTAFRIYKDGTIIERVETWPER